MPNAKTQNLALKTTTTIKSHSGFQNKKQVNKAVALPKKDKVKQRFKPE